METEVGPATTTGAKARGRKQPQPGTDSPFDYEKNYHAVRMERDGWKQLALIAHVPNGAGGRPTKSGIRKARKQAGMSAQGYFDLLDLYHGQRVTPRVKREKRPPTEKQAACHNKFREIVRVAKKLQAEQEGLVWKDAVQKAFQLKKSGGIAHAEE